MKANTTERSVVLYNPRRIWACYLTYSFRWLDRYVNEKLQSRRRILIAGLAILSIGLLSGGFYSLANNISCSFYTGYRISFLLSFPAFLSGFSIFGMIVAPCFLFAVSFVSGMAIGPADFSTFDRIGSLGIFLLTFCLDLFLFCEVFSLGGQSYRSLKRVIRSRSFILLLIVFGVHFAVHFLLYRFP